MIQFLMDAFCGEQEHQVKQYVKRSRYIILVVKSEICKSSSFHFYKKSPITFWLHNVHTIVAKYFNCSSSIELLANVCCDAKIDQTIMTELQNQEIIVKNIDVNEMKKVTQRFVSECQYRFCRLVCHENP